MLLGDERSEPILHIRQQHAFGNLTRSVFLKPVCHIVHGLLSLLVPSAVVHVSCSGCRLDVILPVNNPAQRGVTPKMRTHLDAFLPLAILAQERSDFMSSVPGPLHNPYGIFRRGYVLWELDLDGREVEEGAGLTASRKPSLRSR